MFQALPSLGPAAAYERTLSTGINCLANMGWGVTEECEGEEGFPAPQETRSRLRNAELTDKMFYFLFNEKTRLTLFW